MNNFHYYLEFYKCIHRNVIISTSHPSTFSRVSVDLWKGDVTQTVRAYGERVVLENIVFWTWHGYHSHELTADLLSSAAQEAVPVKTWGKVSVYSGREERTMGESLIAYLYPESTLYPEDPHLEAKWIQYLRISWSNISIENITNHINVNSSVKKTQNSIITL